MSWGYFLLHQDHNCHRCIRPSSAAALPAELSKYEAHLRQPVRIHNIRKKMAEMALLEPTPKKVGPNNLRNSNV